MRREVVDLIIAELKRDVREMHAEERRIWFIRRVMWWRSTKYIVEITGSAILRLAERVAPILRTFMRPGG